MSVRGKEETARLRKNVEAQLGRLLEQLQDLTDFKDELDEDEWVEMKEDTLEALSEMKANLTKMMSGDMTLVSQFGQIQLVRPRCCLSPLSSCGDLNVRAELTLGYSSCSFLSLPNS